MNLMIYRGRNLFFRSGFLALAVSLAGVVQAKQQWHVYDVLGNTVASVNADAVVAEIESTAFGESRTPTAWARFTGKPYDADMGAHVFPFRNYRSDSGRWMSADPSGFPDGANGQAYSPVPVSALDPLGLSSQTYDPEGPVYRHMEGTPDSAQTSGSLTMNIVGVGARIVNQDYGLFEVEFSVASGITSGWIVQHIVASRFSYADEYDTVGTTKSWEYWEQWEVFANGMVNYGGKDSFQFARHKFAGTWTGAGNAKYISVEAASSGTNPDTWDYGFNQPGTLAGSLKATTVEPSWWKNVTGGVSHSGYFSYYE
jgi:RHS repeat-associated protein